MSIYRKYVLVFAFLFISSTIVSQNKNCQIIKAVGDYNLPPLEYLDKNGKPTGFNVELFEAIMSRLGYEYEIDLQEWTNAKNSISAGEADVLIGLTYSALRAHYYNFSASHSMINYVILSKRDDEIKSTKELKGKIVVIQEGDKAQEYLELGNYGQINHYVNDIEEGFKFLDEGKCEALVAFDMVSYYFIDKNKYKDMVIHTLGMSPESYCLALPKDEEELMSEINSALYQIVLDGEYDDIYKKWFTLKHKIRLPAWLIYSLAISLFLLGLLIAISFYLKYKISQATKEIAHKNSDLEQEMNFRIEQHKEIDALHSYLKLMLPASKLYIFIFYKDDSYKTLMSDYIATTEFPDQGYVYDNYTSDSYLRYKKTARYLHNNLGEVRTEVFKLITPVSKSEVYEKYTMKSIVEDGKACILCVGQDVTESTLNKMQLELSAKKAEEADKMKSTFLANMSHEIRTPLNAIVGFSEVLMETETKEDKEEYYKHISNNSEILLRLINDILDLSKIEGGVMQLQSEVCDIALYFNELAETFKTKIKDTGIEFIIDNPYSRKEVFIDKQRFAQIFYNYTSNAIKHTSKGHIRVGYECENGELYLYVEDTGRGIPEEKKHLVFKRFEKLDNYSQGTGLGLAIVQAISEKAGGKCGFESTYGEGSKFWIRIPAPHSSIDSRS